MGPITGTLGYRERMALPEQARIEVVLLDVSKADTKATQIASQLVETQGKQVPFAFELDYDAAKIDTSHHYVVRATIKLGDKLMFTTDTVYPVITDPNQTKKINLMLVRAH